MTGSTPTIASSAQVKSTPTIKEPLCSGTWSEWSNTMKPTSENDGDYEPVNSSTCTNGIENIQCQSTTTGSARQKVTCDKNKGLICYNKDQNNGLCNDYKIRICCVAITPTTTQVTVTTTLETRTPTTATSSETTTPPPPTTTIITPEPLCSGTWSEWSNTMKPTSENDGDYEPVNSSTCTNGIENIQCQSTTTGSARQKVTCDKNKGLICYNKDQNNGLCNDYKIRICCVAITPTTTQVTVTTTPETRTPTTATTPETTTPPPPTTTIVTPEPLCSGTWSEWSNTMKPTSENDGDYEPVNSSTCTNGIENIQCQSTTTGSARQKVTCDKNKGLICYNKDQNNGLCNDYKIRICCVAITPTTTQVTVTTTPETRTPTTATTPETTTPPPPTTTIITPEPLCSGTWSEWSNTMKPTSENDGDYEPVNSSTCTNGIENIQCQSTTTGSARQKVTCDKDKGLICNNKDQNNGLCNDYKIRICCVAITPTTTQVTVTTTPETRTPTTATTPETTTPPPPTTTIITPEPLCSGTWSEWSNTMKPTSENDGDYEPVNSSTCTNGIENIQCQSTTTGSARQKVTCDKNKGLICYNKDQNNGLCNDYKIRICCVAITPTTTQVTVTTTPETRTPTTATTPETTTPPPPTTTIITPEPLCSGTWSEWSNTMKPTSENDGDYEPVNSSTCTNGIENIQCQSTTTGSARQKVTCDKDKGLICNNKDQNNGLCNDYKIRICCVAITPTTTQVTVTTTPETRTPTTATTPETTTPPPPTTTIVTPEPLCSGTWSEWSNTMKPTSENDGDYEPVNSSTCTNGIENIQCQSTTTGSARQKVTCDKDKGLICNNKDQNNGLCNDYKIRICCVAITPTTTQVTVTTTPETRTPTTATTPETTTPPPTTTTIITPEPLCSGTWSEWSNTMKPTSENDGDYEPVNSSTCTNGIENIQCQSTTTGSARQKVTCDKDKGLICNNKDQNNGLCNDYKIRICCVAITPTTTQVTVTTTPETRTPTTATTPETTTPPPTTTTIITPEPLCSGTWSEWSNTMKPTSENDGDYEPVNSSTCTNGIENIQCQSTTTGSARQKVTCDKNKGLICYNKDQNNGLCNDYKIRICCVAITPTTTQVTVTTTLETSTPTTATTPETTTPPPTTTTIITPEPLCSGTWSEWSNTMKPTSENDGDYEPVNSSTCTNGIENIQCQSTTTGSARQKVTCDKNKGLICYNKDQNNGLCNDYKIRICCVAITPTTTQVTVTTTLETRTPTTATTPETTTPPPPTTTIITPEPLCSGTWSEWSNRMKPTSENDGDYEPVNSSTCTNGIENIQCQSTTTGSARQKVTCDKNKGLICYNKDQNNGLCNDYKIRICCVAITPTTTQVTVITTPETRTPTTATTPVTTTPPPTTTIITPEPLCSGTWSEWSNTMKPTSENDGDYEPVNSSTCTNGIENIQCQSTTTGSARQKVTCDKDKGLICNNKDQNNGLCNDYKIRICCVAITPTTTQVTVTTTPETRTPTTATTPETTTPPPPTTTIITPEPLCSGTWSEWSNTMKPTSENDGDYEPVNSSTCTNGIENIQCQSTTTGSARQKVTCDKNKGLICYNKDQNNGLCNDYKIRICCVAITPTTTEISMTTRSETTTPTTTATTTTPETRTPTTTATTPETTTLTRTTTIITREPTATSTISTPVSCYCAAASGIKYKCGDHWAVGCFNYTCINNVIIESRKCLILSKPTCQNGVEPRLVDDGCCKKWDCDCQCEVFGDPHYKTFSGTTYTFLENCTYTLVEEKSPIHNFSIAVDNYNCIPSYKASCARGLILKYKNSMVTLSIENYKIVSKFNNKQVNFPYENDGIQLESTGISVKVFIPAIQTRVSLASYNEINIRIPMSIFENNTQGQCGVCGGTSCIRKDGRNEIDSCCDKTAYDWIYEDASKPYCKSAPKNVPCSTTPPTLPPCSSKPTINNTTLCWLLSSSVFDECRKKVNLSDYEAACKYDHCMLNNTKMDCSSIARAAERCMENNICVEWTKHTNGICGQNCSEGLVYGACHKGMDDYCQAGERKSGNDLEEMTSGCFCPDGLIRADKSSDKCIRNCTYCKGPNGEHKAIGETWKYNCKICTCSKSTLMEECVEEKHIIPSCEDYQTLVVNNATDSCEIAHCVNTTCQHGGKTYQIGDQWHDAKKPCHSYSCNKSGINEKIQVCPLQNCPDSQKVWDDNKCCFTCKGSCVPKTSNKTIQIEDCSAVVTVTECEGQCQSGSSFFLNTDSSSGSMMTICKCCQPKTEEKRIATLACSGSNTRRFKYTYVTSCNCEDCPGK
ncbi:mucin-2-like [Polyodon spathula]|uniref:mucin-2-like n=1 Tax=Polyodon spathula TaxID=7913 RepID=UPI001B7E8958|nr:mucin-2-like [Polyodon spathula]